MMLFRRFTWFLDSIPVSIAWWKWMCFSWIFISFFYYFFGFFLLNHFQTPEEQQLNTPKVLITMFQSCFHYPYLSTPKTITLRKKTALPSTAVWKMFIKWLDNESKSVVKCWHDIIFVTDVLALDKPLKNYTDTECWCR